MKKIIICVVICVLTFASACKREYVSNAYLGKIPAINADLHQKLHNQDNPKKREKILNEQIELIKSEWEIVKEKEIPCMIPEGTPLKVLEPLHFSFFNINDYGVITLTYSGKLIVTEDIPWSQSHSKNRTDEQKKKTEQAILEHIVFDGDTIYKLPVGLSINKKYNNVNCLFERISVPNDKRGFFDYYLTMMEYEDIKGFSWEPPEYKITTYKNIVLTDVQKIDASNIGHSAKGQITSGIGHLEKPFEGRNFWDAGDTIYINTSFYLEEDFIHFKGVKYMLAY